LTKLTLVVLSFPFYCKKKKLDFTEPTASQLTSSDKLSALPSHLRSSPAGRSAAAAARLNKSNSSSAEGTPSEPPPSTATTSETRFAQTFTLPRGAPPISHSLSDSAAEFGTLQRQRISFDSDRGSSTSPRPSEYFKRLGMWRIYPLPGHVLLDADELNDNLQMIVRYPQPASQSSLAATGPPLVLSWHVPTKPCTGVYAAIHSTNTDRDIRAEPLRRAGTAQSHIHALLRARAPRNAPPLLRAWPYPCVRSSAVSLL
jgi:hypothetical protein